MKIVINACHGGFGLSHEAMLRYFELSGLSVSPVQDEYKYWTYYLISDEGEISSSFVCDRDLDRDNINLIKVVEEMGSKSYGDYSKLVIVNIPDDVIWEISEYDGYETVVERHRSWSEYSR